MVDIDLEKVKKGIAAETAKILFSFYGGPAITAQLGSAIISTLIKSLNLRPQPKDFREVILKIADKVSSGIIESYASEGNPKRIATALSALNDFQKTLAATPINMEILVDLQLDTRQLEEYILKHQPNYMSSASYHRRQIVNRATRTFSGAILQTAAILPAFPLHVAQGVIKRLDQILKIIDHSFSSHNQRNSGNLCKVSE